MTTPSITRMTVLAAAAVFSMVGQAESQNRFLTISGGGDTGSWYVGSAIISEIVSNSLNNTVMTPQPGGGVANMRTLQSGDSQFAFMFTSTTAQAIKGAGPFDKPHKKLRGIMALAPMYAHLVVRAESDIDSFRDLEGKTVSPGLRAFAGAQTFLNLLQEYDMSVESIEEAGGSVQWLNYSDGAQNMRDGQIDALFSTSALPHSSYNELAASFPIRIVPVSEEVRASYPEEYPGWSKATIPGGTYMTVEEPVKTLADSMGIATSTEVPEDVVYRVTKAIWENRKKLINGYPAYKDLDAGVALAPSFVNGLPMHPGAKRYWKEIGLLE